MNSETHRLGTCSRSHFGSDKPHEKQASCDNWKPSEPSPAGSETPRLGTCRWNEHHAQIAHEHQPECAEWKPASKLGEAFDPTTLDYDDWADLLEAYSDLRVAHASAPLKAQVEKLENYLNGRECRRCGHQVSGSDWSTIKKAYGGVRCPGCKGAVGDWHHHKVPEKKSETSGVTYEVYPRCGDYDLSVWRVQDGKKEIVSAEELREVLNGKSGD